MSTHARKINRSQDTHDQNLGEARPSHAQIAAESATVVAQAIASDFPDSGNTPTPATSEILVAEITAAYGGDKLGKKRILDAVRAGLDLQDLRCRCFLSAVIHAHNGVDGYVLNKDGRTLSTNTGSGKNLSNDFSMAVVAAKTGILPEQNESLSGWYDRVVTKPKIAAKASAAKAPVETQAPATVQPVNISSSISAKPLAINIDEVSDLITPQETAPVQHAPAEIPQVGKGKIAEIQAIIIQADKLDDDSLQALINSLQNLQVIRAKKRG